MKQLTNIVACTAVACMLILSGCSNGASNKKEAEVKATTTQKSIITEVPFTEATTAILNYGNFWRAQPNSSGYINTVTRAFRIPASDLIGVLDPTVNVTSIIDECRYKYARAYLGMDANQMVHLYFTPVEDDGSAAGKDVILTNGAGEQIVFDLTAPCPNACDAASPLFKAFDLP